MRSVIIIFLFSFLSCSPCKKYEHVATEDFIKPLAEECVDQMFLRCGKSQDICKIRAQRYCIMFLTAFGKLTQDVDNKCDQ